MLSSFVNVQIRDDEGDTKGDDSSTRHQARRVAGK